MPKKYDKSTMKNKELNKTYYRYKKSTNMTFKQLLNWSNNPISQTASIKPKYDSVEAKQERVKLKLYLPKRLRDKSRRFNTAQLRNLVLLYINKSKWDKFLISQAKKSINYLKRSKKRKGIINKRALMNWGYKK